ncbi:MAG TPA: YdcF family protein [Actinomycetaceae bacterium]|nr:YdcF family protein [Actinomycetaceae bacterium]
MLIAVLAAGFWWAVFVWAFRRDRRRVRNGLLLLIAVHASISLVVRSAKATLPFGQLIGLAGAIMTVLGVIALGIFLVANGLTMARKEGRTLGNLLSGLAGLALLTAPVAAVALVLTSNPWAIGLAALLSLVSLHLGAAFLVFLAASVLYQLFPRRLPTTGIIIHGSGLIRGQVTPLLRGRLDRAVREREQLLAHGIDPVLVPSGGQGEDEERAEGAAMAEYLLQEAGVPPARVLAETESATTEENLDFSHRILEEAGHQGPFLITTSGYHAFRAALLARSLGYADEAIGGRTTFYYVPSATLREFLAVLSYRKAWLVVTMLPSLGLVSLVLMAGLSAAQAG